MHENTKILLVDDDALVLKSTRLMLQQSEPQWVVDLAESAQEAMRHEDLDQYHAVVVDYNMPGLNGLQLASRLKESAPETAVIFLTGRGSEEVARDAFSLGAADYIIKGEADASRRLLDACRRARDSQWSKQRLDRLVDRDLPFGLVLLDSDHLPRHFNQSARRIIQDLGGGAWLSGGEQSSAETPVFVTLMLAQAKTSGTPPDKRETISHQARLVGASSLVYQASLQQVALPRPGEQSQWLLVLTPEQVSPRPSPELSPREREVLNLVLSGMSNATIAKTLFISEVTVKAHVSSLLRKYSMDSRAQLVANLLGARDSL